MEVAGLPVEHLILIGDRLADATTRLLLDKGRNTLPNKGDERERLRQCIKDNIVHIDDIQDSIDRRSEQLSRELTCLRSAHLTGCINKITSHYDTVYFALREYTQTEGSDEKWDEKKNHARIQIEAVLHSSTCVDIMEIQDCLADIHSALNLGGKESLVELAKHEAMRGSTDFLSYSMKMETFFGQIWIAEAKALSLLKMARQWPRMHFAEADDTIDKYQSYLVSQEKAFEKVIGPHVMVLVEAVRKNPGGLVLVNFQTYDKSWPHPRSDPDLGVHVLGVGNRKDIKEHPWALKLSCPIEEPTPEGSYPFELVSLEPSDPDCPLVSAPCLSPCIMVPGNSKASWLIKPLENGKFSFSFYSLSMDLDALPSTMGLGKFYEKSNGLYLDLGPEDSILCGRDFDAEKVDSSEGCGFFLTPK